MDPTGMEADGIAGAATVFLRFEPVSPSSAAVALFDRPRLCPCDLSSGGVDGCDRFGSNVLEGAAINASGVKALEEAAVDVLEGAGVDVLEGAAVGVLELTGVDVLE